MRNPPWSSDERNARRAPTEDGNGARRAAWADWWKVSQAWLRAKMDAMPVEIESDQSGEMSSSATVAVDAVR